MLSLDLKSMTAVEMPRIRMEMGGHGARYRSTSPSAPAQDLILHEGELAAVAVRKFWRRAWYRYGFYDTFSQLLQGLMQACKK